jgi:hypothetical protein
MEATQTPKIIQKLKQCKQCGSVFRRTSPYNGSPYCSEPCRAAARRIQQRNYMRIRRRYVRENAGTNDFVDTTVVGGRVKAAVELERMSKRKR